MSPLRRIMQKLGRPANQVAEPPRLCAFGKLPTCSEFLQFNAGENLPKHFQNWIKTGHDHWVTQFPSPKRGHVIASYLDLALPQSSNQRIAGCIWPSHDGASPPRSFPFSLFVIYDVTGDSSSHTPWDYSLPVWSKLREKYEALSAQASPFASLNGSQGTLDDVQACSSDASVSQAEEVRLSEWSASMVSMTQCNDAIELLSLVAHSVAAWRENHTAKGIAFRLPLSGKLPSELQAQMWSRWLQSQFEPGVILRWNAFIPMEITRSVPCVTFILRVLRYGDFQLLTSNANEYGFAEDFTTMMYEGSEASRDTKMKERCMSLLREDPTLWSWSGTPL